MNIDNQLRLGINQIGFFGKGFGLGEASRLILESLKQGNIPVSLISANNLLGNLRDEPFSYPIDNVFKYPINLFTIDSRQIPVVVQQYSWEPFKNRYNIGLVFWETTYTSQEYLDGWRYLDEIWTTSKYMKDILSKLAPVPVYHIPQPLELNYPYQITNKVTRGISDDFTFLFFFSFNSVLGRKNPQAIIEAFQLAFPNRKDVRLIIKSKDSHHFSEQFQNMQKKIEGDSRLIWIDKIMDEQDRFDLMESCDCYVSLHRSEGFGLTMAEAMLFNKPVIGTGYSGNMDFMNADNSYLCSYRFVEVGQGNWPYPPKGIWADPDIHHAAQLMQWVVENPEEASFKACKGREFVQKNHNFKRVGMLINQRLASIPMPIKTKYKPWHYIKERSSEKINKILSQKVNKVLSHVKKPIKKILKQLKKLKKEV